MSNGDFLAPADLRIIGTCERLESIQVRSLRFLSAQTYPNGAICYVRSVKCYFRLDRSSTSTDDSLTVLNAKGGGRWHRMSADFLTESPWLEQDEWYIDPANGDDELGGDTAETAIATHAEFERRMGRNPLITQTVTVNIYGDLDEVLSLEASFLGVNAVIHYLGRATVLLTGSISNWVAFNIDQEGWVSSAQVPNFSAYLGRRLQITSGDRAGYYTFISALATGHVGGNRGRVGAITAITGTPPNKDNIDIRANDDSGGENTFQIEQLPTVRGLQLRAHRLKAGLDLAWGDQLTFLVDGLHPQNIALEETAIVMDCDANNEEPNIMLYRCLLSNYDGTKIMGRSLAIWSCSAANLTGISANGARYYSMQVDMRGQCGGTAIFWDCVLPNGQSSALFRNNYFDGPPNARIIEFMGGTRMGMNPFGGGGLDFGVYGTSTSWLITIDSSSQIVVDDVWGAQTGTGPGWRVDGRAIYDTVGEIDTFVVGAGSDTVVGGANVAYGALPSVNANNNAMFVVEW